MTKTMWTFECDLPVAKPWAEQVCDGEESGEEPLRDNDRASEEEPGLFQLQEREQVHPLVLSLLLQHPNNHDVQISLNVDILSNDQKQFNEEHLEKKFENPGRETCISFLSMKIEFYEIGSWCV